MAIAMIEEAIAHPKTMAPNLAPLSLSVGWAVPINAIATFQGYSKHCPPYMNHAD